MPSTLCTDPFGNKRILTDSPIIAGMTPAKNLPNGSPVAASLLSLSNASFPIGVLPSFQRHRPHWGVALAPNRLENLGKDYRAIGGDIVDDDRKCLGCRLIAG